MNFDIDNFKLTDKDGVLVKCKYETTLTSDSGIYLGKASVVEDRPTQGEVVQVGSNVKDVKVGDIVMWAITSGIDFYEKDGEAYIILDESRILGIVEEG